MTVGDDSAKEGDPLTFTVALSPPKIQSLPVDFQYRTWPGTATERPPGATAGGDYQGQSWTDHAIAAGQTQTTLPAGGIATFPDTQFERTESLQLQIRITDTDSDVGLAKPAGTGLIDDATPLLVSVADASAVEGDTLGFLVTLSNRVDRQVTVQYATANDTADGADYTTAAGTLTFLARQDAQIIRVDTIRDADNTESNETLYLNLSNSVGAQIDDGLATGTILPANQPTISVRDARSQEGDPLEFTVEALDGPPNGAATVDYATALLASSPNPATPIVDYVPAPAPGTNTSSITIAFDSTGAGTATISIYTHTDTHDEGPYEELRLELSNPQDAVLDRATAIGRIDERCLDPNDPNTTPPTITAQDAAIDINEGAPNPSIPLTFRLSSPLCINQTPIPTVNYGYTDGTAAAPADYIGAAGQAAIGWGTIELPAFRVVDDTIAEQDEIFTVAVHSWATGVASQFTALSSPLADATVTIVDDDDKPS